jgi:hypothetical protein
MGEKREESGPRMKACVAFVAGAANGYVNAI